MSFFRSIPGSSVTISGGATAANQVLILADLASILAEISLEPKVLYRTTGAISNAAYTEISASLAEGVKSISYFNSTGQTLALAIGAAASETNTIYLPPGGSSNLQPFIGAATDRISVTAISATTSVGELSIVFYG